jgi:hypothetical protein
MFHLGPTKLTQEEQKTIDRAVAIARD